MLSGLAKGFVVCDGWFASLPTQTFPNRVFAVAGTSLGYTDNSAHGTPAFKYPSVFGKIDCRIARAEPEHRSMTRISCRTVA